jgi:hypothetical protein
MGFNSVFEGLRSSPSEINIVEITLRIQRIPSFGAKHIQVKFWPFVKRV